MGLLDGNDTAASQKNGVKQRLRWISSCEWYRRPDGGGKGCLWVVAKTYYQVVRQLVSHLFQKKALKQQFWMQSGTVWLKTKLDLLAFKNSAKLNDEISRKKGKFLAIHLERSKYMGNQSYDIPYLPCLSWYIVGSRWDGIYSWLLFLLFCRVSNQSGRYKIGMYYLVEIITHHAGQSSKIIRVIKELITRHWQN